MTLSASASTRTKFSDYPFSLGVASGDPLPDGVVLWTRLAPKPLELDGSGGMPAESVKVGWQIAEDAAFRKVVRSGTTTASPELGHSVHVEATGLRPDRVYHFRFRAGSEVSPVGRTRTAPAPDAAIKSLTVGTVSCQHYPSGYYTAYHHLAAEDVDLILHVGDYIYEDGAPGKIGRAHAPDHEITTLADYRVRYGQYKSDKNLQAAHAHAPWLVVPDDHEVENNYADETSQANDPVEQFRARRAAAYQAYYENQPLRASAMPKGPDMQLYRRYSFGRLAQINMLDGRQFRSDQGCGDSMSSDCADRLDPGRTMLGDEQEKWLLDGLDDSDRTWNILGNQVLMADADSVEGSGKGYMMDNWNGYVAARQRLFDGIAERRVDNVVVLTGDAHMNAAANLKQDFGDQSSKTVGVEFMGTSITSGGDGADNNDLGRRWLEENPHIDFVNTQRGYMVTEFTQDAVSNQFKVVDYVTTAGAPVNTRATGHVESGKAGIAQMDL